MSAIPIGDIANRIVLRAQRTAILGEFIGTIPDGEEKIRVIMALCECRVITNQTAELLIESFCLEAG